MVLALPLLPIEAYRTQHAARKKQPLVLTHTCAQQQLVAACCEQCLRVGVRVGTTVGDARAVLAPSTLFVQHDASRDLAAIKKIARFVMRRYSPVVAIDRKQSPPGLVVNITGCAHLFGGEEAMLARVLRALSAKGFAARGAIAPSAACARAIARFASARMMVVDAGGSIAAAIAPLPLQALGIDASQVAAMEEVGMHTIAHLLAQPRAAIAARFGADVLRALDACMCVPTLHAEHAETLRHRAPLHVQHNLAGPCMQIQALSVLLREMLASLCNLLQARECGVRKLDVVLTRSDAPPITLSVTLSTQSRDAAHLWSLLAPRFENVNLGHGVERLSVIAAKSQRVQHPQAMLTHAGASHAGSHYPAQHIAHVCDTLIARLGDAAVLQATVRDCHQPQRAVVWRQAQQLALHLPGSHASASRHVEACHAGLSRPCMMFPEPIASRVLALSPDGPVLSVQWLAHTSRVVRCIGPERIGGAWWLASKHASQHDCDYFAICDDAGRWLWLRHELDASAAVNEWSVVGAW